MGSATGFIWMAVVILALGWALELTGTISLGLNLNVWLPVLLVLAVMGAVFNMFVVPFLGRTRTTTTTANATGSMVPAVVPATVPRATAPAAGATQQEVVQQTRDQTSL